MGPLDRVLGASPAMVAIRQQVVRLLAGARSGRRPQPVLIQGETGTGKGLLARVIHDESPRAAGAFVSLNCAAIPENLLEAELFGVERGAFTGAQPRSGLFQAAHGGTLFLDEVGALPLRGQAKLLTAIEDRVVRPLGGTRGKRVDTWIIAATSVDLRRAMAARRFREDLYHRLAVILLALPPLRERGRDILELAELFLARACAELGSLPKTLGPDARDALRSHSWPGNVRELANAMERVALLWDAPAVTAAGLELSAETPALAEDDGPTLPVRDALAGFERTRIVAALERTGWNVARAAGLLGVPRTTLRRRMRQYRLSAGGQPVSRAQRTRLRDRPPGRSRSGRGPSPPRPPRGSWERRAVTLLGVELGGAGTEAPGGSGRAMEEVTAKVRAFGGHLARIGTNRLVAAFGVEPVGDAPVRAVQAALAMQRAMDRLEDDLRGRPWLKAAVHVARVSVGQGPGPPEVAIDDEHPAWSVLGDLLAQTEPDAALASVAAAPHLGRGFLLDVAPRAPGRPEAFTVRRRPLEPVGPPGRSGSRFVGREHELAVLDARLTTVERGHGHVVGIIGEPGLGKSRLLLEFRRRLASGRARYLEGHCVASGQGTPYGPLLDLLRGTCGIAEGTSPEETAERVRDRLARVHLDPEAAAPYLLRLLDVPHGAERLARLSGEAVRLRTFEALRQLWLRASLESPLVLAVEDLHWVDATSEAFLGALADALPGARLLVCVTYRPGYQPPWMGRSNTTQLALPHLSRGEGLILARSLLGGVDAADRVAREILPRAAGNPFFIEELIRSAGDRPEPDPGVPKTVQATILGRVHQLPAAEGRLLRMASVLGREVSVPLLREMWAEPGDLDGHLRELLAREFLESRPGAPDGGYAFKHALTQEVAYGLLAPPERRALHLAAARILERQHAKHLDAVDDRLAHHFARAERPGEAVAYLIRVADDALRGYALRESVSALREALGQAARLPPGRERDRLTLELVVREAYPLTLLGHLGEARAALRAQERSGDEVGNDPIVGPYHFWLAHLHDQLGHGELAITHANRAIAEATRWGDSATIGQAHFVLSLRAFWDGRQADGIEHGKHAVSALGGTLEQQWLGLSGWALSLNAVTAGDFALALDAARHGKTVAETISDSRLGSYAWWVMGWVSVLRGDGTGGVEACEQALQVARDPLAAAVARQWLGYAYTEQRAATRATVLLDEAVEQFQLFRYRALEGFASAWLSEALLLDGQIDAARRVATRALILTTTLGFPFGIGLAQRALGRIARAAGEEGEAIRRLTDGLQTFSAIEARYEVARTHLDLGRIRRDQGVEAAAGHLAEARALFERLEVPYYAERAAELGRELAVP